MDKVSNIIINRFKNGYRQSVEIQIDTVNESFTITDADILQRGMSVNRTSVSGDILEIGNVNSAELSLSLYNTDGRFDGIELGGAKLTVKIGIKDWSNPSATIQYVNVGVFTVDNSPKRLKTIEVTALDNMVLFDKPVNNTVFYTVTGGTSYPISADRPTTVKNVFNKICEVCGVTAPSIDDLPNAYAEITSLPASENTYRQYLSWCLQILGCNGYMDGIGQFQVDWYSGGAYDIPITQRFSSYVYEKPIQVTGVQTIVGQTPYTSDNDNGQYSIRIEGNPFITVDNAQDIVTNLTESICGETGFIYTPFEATVTAMPYLLPMNKVNYITKDGVSIPSVVTDITFVVNGNTEIAGRGETETSKGYASLNPLTAKEAAIVENIQKQSIDPINSRVQALLDFNNLISNAMGLYTTQDTDETGAVTVYLHDGTELENSSFIVKMNAAGFAWTNDGKNGEFKSGLSPNGNAILNWIYANGITVASGNTYKTNILPDTFSILYNEQEVTRLDNDEMITAKGRFSKFVEVGLVKTVPAYGLDGALVGTDEMFIGG